MPPMLPSKTFNMPFSGGAATIVCLAEYSNFDGEVSKMGVITQYNSDGTTVDLTYGDMSLSVSVSNGVMTATLTALSGYTLRDCRCCLIPGDPFA